MLVLKRKVSEVIVAGDVVITVVRIEGNQVRLGITAPKEINIYREEVRDAKTRNDP